MAKLINVSNEIDFVKKLYQFGDQIIVNFVLIKLKNQVNLFYFFNLVKKIITKN
jgi:hypothetical protein